LADLRTRVLQLAARNRIDEESGTRLEDLTRLAHSVKGSSASVAAARLAGVAAELETLGRTAMEGGDCFDGSGADVLVARLDEEFRRVEPVLQTALLGTAA
jgi:HPt (histidine-containing phosphotransfer) domain-containing protein